MHETRKDSMKDETQIKKLLENLQMEYKATTVDIINKCADKEDYNEEYIAQNKIFAQIELINWILE